MIAEMEAAGVYVDDAGVLHSTPEARDAANADPAAIAEAAASIAALEAIIGHADLLNASLLQAVQAAF
jgi:hypothetical protein